jgi:hypothetical protein
MSKVKIKILPKLKEHIQVYCWHEKMYDLIGKEFEVNEKDIGDSIIINNEDNTWMIPKGCYDVLNRKKRKNPIIDPYDEDDWGWETNERQISHIPDDINTKEKIREVIKKFHIDYGTIEQCKSVAIRLHQMGFEVFNYDGILKYEWAHWHSFTYNKHKNFWNRGGIGDYGITYEDFMKLTNDFQNLKRIKNPEVDPLGEEDWGWEEGITESSFINLSKDEFVIIITNKNIFEEVMKKLHKLGYTWWGSNKSILDKKYDHDYEVLWLAGQLISYSDMDYFNNHRNSVVNLTDEEFIKIKDKKLKKLQNKELDPYGEDDWGFEEINENLKKIKSILLFV